VPEVRVNILNSRLLIGEKYILTMGKKYPLLRKTFPYNKGKLKN
jgi:hypothetical protein